MKVLHEYAEKYGVKEVTNDMGELIGTKDYHIVFPNGWIASIVPNRGIDVYHADGTHTVEYKSNKKYSVAMCDYNGYFDWTILNAYDDAIGGAIYCDSEMEIIVACENIRRC